MQADTDAIRGYGGATAEFAADLAEAAALLRQDPSPTVAHVFGSVGARFAAALGQAAADLAKTVTTIGGDVTACAEATAAAAASYDDTEECSGARIARVGM